MRKGLEIAFAIAAVPVCLSLSGIDLLPIIGDPDPASKDHLLAPVQLLLFVTGILSLVGLGFAIRILVIAFAEEPYEPSNTQVNRRKP